MHRPLHRPSSAHYGITLTDISTSTPGFNRHTNNWKEVNDYTYAKIEKEQ